MLRKIFFCLLGGRGLCLFVIIFLGMLTHLPGIMNAEFRGEDELLFHSISRAFLTWLQVLLTSFESASYLLKSIFQFYYPPLQWLLPAPLVAFFGTHGWTLRLPGALAGIMAAVVLFLMLDGRGRDRRVAVIAGLLAAGCSVAANHYYALTCGLFAFGGALAAWGLDRFMEEPDARKADRWLWVGACGMTFAAMTLQDGFFYLPVLAAAYYCKRGVTLSRTAWGAIGLVSAWVVAYGVFWILLPKFWQDEGVAGGLVKVDLILSHLGAFRWRDLVWSFASGSSWPMLIAGLLLIPMGWKSASRSQRWVVGFYMFPLALWTFVFGYPNVRAAHMLLAFPAFALLWALGAVRLYDGLQRKAHCLAVGFGILCGLLMLSAFWQTAVLHIVDWLPPSQMGPRWLVLRGYYPQGRRVILHGQRAAGKWVREHTTAEIAVSSNLGGAFADYYSARPPFHPQRVPFYIENPEAARQDGARFFAHALHGGATSVDFEGLPVVLEVRHKGAPRLRLYDLWREATDQDPLILEARIGH